MMIRMLDRGIVFATGALIVLLMLVMTGATLAGVFARYVMNDALTWSEEVARYSMVWLSFLGGGLVFRHGGHVAIELLVERIPVGLPRYAVLALAQFAALAFLAVLVWYGIGLMQRGAFMTTPALRIPMSLPYASIPIGSVLMIYHLIAANVVTYLGKEKVAPEERVEVTLG